MNKNRSNKATYINIPLFLWVLLLFMAFSANGQNKVWTFRECLDTALARNVLVAQSQLNTETNKWNIYRAKGNQIPNLNFSAGESLNFGRSIDPFTNQYVTQNVNSTNFSLNSNLVLFNGFQVRNTIRQNDLNLTASQLDLQKAKNDLSLNVASAYLAILQAYQQIDIQTQQVQSDSLQLTRTQILMNGGKLTENDLLLSKSQLAADVSTLVQDQSQLALSKLALEQLMEQPISDSFEVEKVKMDAPNIHGYVAPTEIFKAAQQLPEVQSALAKTKSNEMGLKIARGGLYPKLTLGGALTTGYSSATKLYNTQTQEVTQPIGYLQNDPTSVVLGQVPVTSQTAQSNTFGKQLGNNFSQQIGLTLAVPIFNNRQVKTNMELAKLNIKNAKFNEDIVALTLRKNIEQAYTNVKSAEKQYSASIDQLTAMKSSYENIQKKYNIGLATAIDLTIEKNLYLQAESQELITRFNYIFNAVILDFYLGKPIAINAQQ